MALDNSDHDRSHSPAVQGGSEKIELVGTAVHNARTGSPTTVGEPRRVLRISDTSLSVPLSVLSAGVVQVERKISHADPRPRWTLHGRVRTVMEWRRFVLAQAAPSRNNRKANTATEDQ